MADNRTFTLIGKFDDQISKKLKEINKVFSEIRKSTEGFGSDVGKVSKSINKMTSSLEDAGRAAGKVRDTVSQIGEGVKGLDGIGESLEAAARAAGRAQDEVLGIGEAAGRANRQADDLMNTLLKAEGLSKFGDAMAQGLNRGMNVVMNTVQKGAGVTAKLFKDAMDDEMADIKAASGMQGSFGLAGFKGDFKDAQRMYKAYDKTVAEMIRQSSAPTAKVVELQRYTLDTMGPLMLAAQGVKKGTAMKDIDPKKIEASAKQYGQFLEKAALFSQGTGSAGFRVAAGIEGLVTRGKIDTTIDFFTDNVMLMKNLEAAGFAGRGMRSSKLMNATDAQRMAAMMEAFNKSMSSESTKAMASSLTGSLQGLQDTIFNPSVGILGMSVTFTKDEQKRANEAIKRIQNARITRYQQELKNTVAGSEREKQLRINIEQAQLTRDQLISEDVISTPFKAFSYAFSGLVQQLTNAINAIGPIWTNFAVAAIEVTNKVFGPLGETLGNVASDMRAKKVTQMEGFGRIVGEIFKTIGQIMGDIANMINDPNSAMGKAQSEFMKGFMAAFKDPGTLRAAQEGIKNGLSALIGKFFEFLWKAITFEPIRPLMLLFVAGIFGPPLIGAVIAGATPLIISAIGRMILGATGGGVGAGVGAAGAGAAGGGLRALLGGQLRNASRAGALIPGVRGAMGVASAAKMQGIGLAAAGIVKLATVSPKLLEASKGIANIARSAPLLNVAFGALDFTARRVSGQSNLQAGLGAGGGLTGSLIGAAIGTAILPGLGTAIGGALGGFAGGSLGDLIASKFAAPSEVQRQAAETQMQASAKQLQASNARLSGMGVAAPAGGAGIADPMKLGATIRTLGLEGDKLVQAYANNVYKARTLADQTQAAKDALFAKVAEFKKIGYDPKTIWKQGEVQKLQTDYARLQKATGNAAKQVDVAFNAMPQHVSKAIMSNMAKMSTREASMALAAKVNEIQAPKISFNFSGMPYGPGGSTPASPFVFPSKPGKSNPAINPLTGKPWFSANGSLGDAISAEMRMKPPGSNLVIANSSETIIPAAGGNGGGMVDFVRTMYSGFTSVVATLNRVQQAQDKSLGQINQTLVNNQQQTNTRLAKLETKFSAPGMGSLGGGGVAGVDAFTPMARGYGLTMTSGFRPGDPGWHGVNSARDYSNGTGPTPQMMAFARFLASNYGSNLKELIYTPLGFGIKNGQKVAPYARAAHYNHVHVAYALGAGMPAFFSSQTAARNWERKATLGNVKVSSITSNSSEGFGGTVTVNAPITIHQQPGQNSEHLASLVAAELSAAIRQARSSSMYV
jgi:hypothetical protein